MKQLITLLFALIFSTLHTSLSAQPLLSFDQNTQELGTLLWHTPRTAIFKFTNKGTTDLRITEVRTDCGCTAVDWTRTPVCPGGTGTIQATYDAEMLGHFQKGIAVYTDLDNRPVYLTLMGQVSMTQTEASMEFPYKIGDYYLSTDNIEFDDVNRGDEPSFVLNIHNAGKKSYTPELMHLPKYLIAEAVPEVIRPGRTGRIILTLNSADIGSMGLTQTSIYLSRFPGDRVCKDTEINVSVTLLPDLSDTAMQQDQAPVASIDSTHICLGPLGKKKRANGELLLRNTGRSPLVISALQVYNPGISVSIGRRRIEPGAAEKLKISVNANNTFFKGRRRILLITNDPQNPKMVIDVEVKQ